MLRISDFRTKEVVNVSDGKRLGHVLDFDIDLDSGRINKVVVPTAGKGMRIFAKDEKLTIPWSNIVKIGEDVILVRVPKQYIED